MYLQQAIRQHQAQADRHRSDLPEYQPGQKVWLSTRDIRRLLPCRKLSPRYIGPFTVQRHLNEGTYQLNLPPEYRIAASFHVSLLKPYTDPVFPHFTDPITYDVPPPIVPIKEDPIYRVCDILDSRRRGTRVDYGPEERSWVPCEDILNPTLLTQFHYENSVLLPDPCSSFSTGVKSRLGGGGTVRITRTIHIIIHSSHSFTFP